MAGPADVEVVDGVEGVEGVGSLVGVAPTPTGSAVRVALPGRAELVDLRRESVR